jgi:hypothetical protein
MEGDDVASLCSAVFHGQGGVLGQMETVFVQKQASGNVYSELSEMHPKPGRTQYGYQRYKQYEIPMIEKNLYQH